jgi:hypothetical protein
MFEKEPQYIIKGLKKTIFYILKILIKIGNVCERILINHKRYKKNNILHLENILKNRECLGKNSNLS